jgi:hypothetical protein
MIDTADSPAKPKNRYQELKEHVKFLLLSEIGIFHRKNELLT